FPQSHARLVRLARAQRARTREHRQPLRHPLQGCLGRGAAVRRGLEFAWIPGGWDADRDGVMEGVQHNTYDVEFFGPNPQCGLWYLAALRAAEEMARVVGEAGAAREYRALFEKGRQLD